MSCVVACLDVYEDNIREIIRRHAPEGWVLRMAKSYDEREQRRLIEDADMILTGWSPVPGWMFSSKRLKLIQKFGVGYDKIDIEAAKNNGVSVAIAAGLNAVPVSELVILLILALYRKLLYLDQTLRAGKWVKSEMRSKSFQIYGKTVGLIGFGSVGKEVAKRLQAFEAKVIYHDIIRLTEDDEKKLKVAYFDLDTLLKTADIISLHLPLNGETKGIINKSRIDMMKKGAILINTARGELVSEDDLVRALQGNQLLGAGLDVYAHEPLDVNHPFLKLENVVLTPHIGGTVFDNVARMAEHCFNNMKRYLAGEPLSPRDMIVDGNRSSR